MIVATIDVGTNTALLLVAEIDAAGRLTSLHEARRFVRLGEGVDASGEVSPAAQRRLRDALRYYKTVASSWQAEHIIVAATSASRDARNVQEVRAMVARDVGLSYDVLSGEAEAQWTFAGAVSAFSDLDPHGACAVIDIGGGSTELVLGCPGTRPSHQQSFDIGAVRLTERFYEGQPSAPEAVARAEAFVRNTLTQHPLPLDPTIPLIAASGTVLVLALVHFNAMAWADLQQAHVALSYDTVADWRARLATMSYDEILALNPAIMEGRADVFPAGVMILETVMRQYGLDACRVSPRGLRHGLAIRFREEGG